MKKRIYIETPDLVLLPKNDYKDVLEIYVRGSKIRFNAKIDDCGNDFEISKKELLRVLNDL